MRSKNQGFTIIELVLAMAFLSLLLIAIAVSTIHIAKLYDKGITIRTVNQSGRDLTSNIQRDARSVGTLAEYYVSPERDSNGMGRLCLGSVSYVWNTANALRNNTGVRYKTTTGAQLEQITMARVSDIGGSLCRQNPSGEYSADVMNNQATELLKSVEHDLAVHDFTFEPFLSAAGRSQLYLIKFTLGTNEDRTIETDLTCKPPENAQSNFDFCAVNNFELIVSVG